MSGSTAPSSPARPSRLATSRRPTIIWAFTGLVLGIVLGRAAPGSVSSAGSVTKPSQSGDEASDCAWARCCLDQCPDVRRPESPANVLTSSVAEGARPTTATSADGTAAASASLERSCVPSPVEAASRFSEANVDGSDKTTFHSYHLMYGPFLAPYLDKPVVRETLYYP